MRKYRPTGFKGDAVELELAEPAIVSEAVKALGVPDNLIYAVFVNDKQVALDTQLSPGDMVRIFPPVAGGAAIG